MNNLKVGVVGYSHNNFDRVEGWNILKQAFIQLQKEYKTNDFHVISGLTDYGIPQTAYYIAKQNGWSIGGIACERAKEHPWFPMSDWGDTLKIVGQEWGDESEEFLDSVDVVIRVAGGNQSHQEIQRAKEKGIKTYEYELSG